MPNLTIIAGCNGAGKSTFSQSFLPKNVLPFDYDKLYLKNYKSLPDSELRDVIAKNKTTDTFNELIENALSEGRDFCYETNFDSYPIHWAEKFKGHGYNLVLIFFCIENQNIARDRIKVRKEFKGHFVNNETIDLKWRAGYRNMNDYYSFFDRIMLVDNSINNQLFTNLLQIENGKLKVLSHDLPNYIEWRFPSIFKQINKK